MRALLLGLILLTACSGANKPAMERGAVGTCTRVQAQRAVRGQMICEDVWTCVRPPGGPFDRVGLRRLANCDRADGPSVVYLPGMHMNGEVPFAAAANDIRLYLAQSGFRVWAIDYRSHALPPEATAEQLAVMNTWTPATYADDVAWALGFVRGADPGAPFLMGFSYGAGLVYRVAARDTGPIAGLVILDGKVGVDVPPSAGAIDVGSTRLPYGQRQALLAAAKRGPDGASPIPGYSSAGQALADILYTAQSFGGQGGLSNAKNDASDPQIVAVLLASYDRWWPRGATSAGAVQPSRTLPVLAFSNGQMGSDWQNGVRSSAQAFGGGKADVRVLPGLGHLDVLVGKQAVRDVFEPARTWMTSHSGLTR